MVDASRYLNVYDTAQIYSWTPREFKNFIKGAQLRQIDEFESLAVGALFNAKVKSKKKVSLKDIFNAEKSRKELESDGKKEPVNLEHWRKAQAALKRMSSMSMEKGG